MEGSLSLSANVINDSHDGNGIYRIGGLTIQVIPIWVNVSGPYTLNFPEAFKTNVIACFVTNDHVGFSAVQTVSVGAVSLSQFMVYQNNTMNADCHLTVVAIGY